MTAQLITCLIIFTLTCAGYIIGIYSLATVAMASVAALSLTGCLSAAEALGYFSNNTVIMIGAMSVVAAGFSKTRSCSSLADGISRAARGSFNRVMLLYCILTMLLSQMVQSPVVVYGIVAPLCMAFADSVGVSRSRVAMALGVVACIAVSYVSGQVAWRTCPGWEDYVPNQEAASSIADYPRVSYEDVSRVASQLSKNDVDMLYDFMFVDSDPYSLETFQAIDGAVQTFSTRTLMGPVGVSGSGSASKSPMVMSSTFRRNMSVTLW